MKAGHPVTCPSKNIDDRYQLTVEKILLKNEMVRLLGLFDREAFH
jgi:hypothetical protein